MIVIDLSTKKSLVVHLKMTGQLVYKGSQDWGGGHPSDSLVGSLPDKSTRIIFDLIDDNMVTFQIIF
jgi:formamidopyrimidine-DNA glycosylase